MNRENKLDQEAFRRGVSDMMTLAPLRTAIGAFFRQSDKRRSKSSGSETVEKTKILKNNAKFTGTNGPAGKRERHGK